MLCRNRKLELGQNYYGERQFAQVRHLFAETAAFFRHSFSLDWLDKLSFVCHTSNVEILAATEERMALDAHVAELSDKHRALEKKIQHEMARPSADSLTIAELKREKLRIKDELARLRGRNS